MDLQTFPWTCKDGYGFVWILRKNEMVLYGLLSFENSIHLQINKEFFEEQTQKKKCEDTSFW